MAKYSTDQLNEFVQALSLTEYEEGTNVLDPDASHANIAKMARSLKGVIPIVSYEAVGQMDNNLTSFTALFKELADLTATLAYQGFDTRRILTQLWLHHSASGHPRSVFIKDMGVMIQMLLMRGTSIVTENGKKKMTPAGRALVESFVRKYSIVPTAGGDPYAITLSRVSACFPLTTIQVLKHVPAIERPYPQ